MEPKVSIIVPVYNTEKYLNKCIESIRNQTLKEIEIILIDDGSSDKSTEILDKYSAIDSRIIVIHQENLGQGAARDRGIEIAKGEYIGFVDSDDWVDLDMYEKLYSIGKDNRAEMVVCNRRVYKSNNEISTVIDVGNSNIKNVKENTIDYLINNLFYPYSVSCCNKIYLRDVIDGMGLRFKSVKDVGSEDLLFNICYILKTNISISINSTYHNQLAREGSTTRRYTIGAMERTGKLINSLYALTLDEVLKDKKEVQKLLAPLVLLFFQQWNYNLIKTYGGNLKEDLTKEHKEINKNKFMKKAERTLIFNPLIIPYMKKMGFSLKGRIYIRAYMLCCLCNLNKLATMLRVL